MPALVASPEPADAEPIPGGVAASDGAELYVQVAGGIDAIDPATGAVRWHTSTATVPVLATDRVLLAIDAASAGDLIWSGSAAVVTIDRAEPHAARRGTAFTIPRDRARILDARVVVGALEAWWFALALPREGILPAPPPTQGTLRVDLATATATVDERGWIPAAVGAAIAGQTAWSPPGRGVDPWRAGDGWSVIALMPAGDTRVPTLRHWSATSPERAVAVLDPAQLGTGAVLHVDRRHAFLRACDPEPPHACAVRIIDAVTGAPVATAVDVEPPFALIGRTLYATRADGPARRTLVAIDLDRGELWRRPFATSPFPSWTR